MTKIPKPIPCNERWANMKPADGGRICQSCTKLIVDFRKKSWNNISEIQSKNDNSICGIYSNKQLKHWGQEPHSNFGTIKKTASIIAISSAITTTVLAQDQNNTNELVIYGTITGDYYSKQKEKNIQGPIENAVIRLKSLNIESKTDSLGNFSFTLQKSQINDSVIELTTKAKWYGEQKISVNTNLIENDSLIVNHYLKPTITKIESPPPTMFYAAPPTLRETLKEKIDTLNGNK